MKKQYIYALITVFVWGTTAPVTKVMLGVIPNFQVLAVTSFMAAAYLIVTNAWQGNWSSFREYGSRQYAGMAGLGFLGIFAYSALYNYGIGVLSSQEACILNYLWPMMLILFSCLILKERMTLLKGMAVLCSFVGMILLVNGEGSASTGHIAGMVACVIAAASYGLFSVLNKKADFDQNVSMLVFWMVSGVGSLVCGLATETWVMLSVTQWIGLAWLGVVGNGVGYLLWALALHDVKNTAKIANLAYLVPFLSVFLSAVFLKETLHGQALAALLLIVGGVAIQGIADSKQ